MEKAEFDSLLEYVLSKLLENNSLSVEASSEHLECVNKLYNEKGHKAGRAYLLRLVSLLSAKCVACPRHQQRINPVASEGGLDVPMLIGSTPSYVDTLTSRPFSGMPEVLTSRCGRCIHKEEHISPALYPMQAHRANLQQTNDFCRYEETSEWKNNKQILLPMAFQSLDKQVKPLGTGGQVLDRLLLDIGHRRLSWGKGATVHLTNTVLCPSIEESGEVRPPGVREKAACRLWLDLTIQIVKPRIIVCIGAEALNAFFKNSRVGANAEKVLPHPDIAIPFGVTYNPASVIHGINDESSGRIYGIIRKHLHYYLNSEEFYEKAR